MTEKFNFFCPTGHRIEFSKTTNGPLCLYYRNTNRVTQCNVESTGLNLTSTGLTTQNGCTEWSAKQWFNHVCQGHVRDLLNGCELNWNWRGYGCSSFFGPNMEARGYKPACIIHDMCYESGRLKSSCDTEFRDNLGQLGMEYVQRQIVYAAVRDHGRIRRKKTC